MVSTGPAAAPAASSGWTGRTFWISSTLSCNKITKMSNKNWLTVVVSQFLLVNLFGETETTVECRSRTGAVDGSPCLRVVFFSAVGYYPEHRAFFAWRGAQLNCRLSFVGDRIFYSLNQLCTGIFPFIKLVRMIRSSTAREKHFLLTQNSFQKIVVSPDFTRSEYALRRYRKPNYETQTDIGPLAWAPIRRAPRRPALVPPERPPRRT